MMITHHMCVCTLSGIEAAPSRVLLVGLLSGLDYYYSADRLANYLFYRRASMRPLFIFHDDDTVGPYMMCCD